MKPLKRQLLVTLLIFSFFTICTISPTEEAPDKTQKNTSAGCVEWYQQSRYVSGYDHLVHLKNLCKVTMVCIITTDTNPDPIETTIKPSEKKTVLTFRGSPSRVFKAKVTCAKST
jgi:hypothetical protein